MQLSTEHRHRLCILLFSHPLSSTGPESGGRLTPTARHLAKFSFGCSFACSWLVNVGAVFHFLS
uniref:Uncharacterized protein n=1 Tax=Anguilla anguilla TaxID=7936 RepID=A0A0E9RW57_ANGAN